MEIKRYIKTEGGGVYDTTELDRDNRLTDTPFVTKDFWCIYPQSIVASSDDVVKLFDCFLVDKNCFDNFIMANTHHKRHNKDKKLYGATWSKEGKMILAVAEYLGQGEWLLYE